LRSCTVCNHPARSAIEQKIRADVSFSDIARWLATTEHPVSRMSLSRHAEHVALTVVGRPPGPRPLSGKFVEKVIGAAEQFVDEGGHVSVSEGLKAQALADDRANKQSNEDLLIAFAQIISGGAPGRAIGPGDIDYDDIELPEGWDSDEPMP
jgi:hypothetical protein